MHQDIHNLVERYKTNRDFYLTDRYNETQVRSDFLDPLFELLGWDIKNRAGKPTNEREVILEEPLKVDIELLKSSRSDSASFCTGVSTNGNMGWVDSRGRTFKEVFPK